MIIKLFKKEYSVYNTVFFFIVLKILTENEQNGVQFEGTREAEMEGGIGFSVG